MHEIGVREVVHFAGLTFNWETLFMTWLTMAIVILIVWLAQPSQPGPNRFGYGPDNIHINRPPFV